MAAKKKNMIRISELARRAQVSAPTVKHYLNQGLLQKPVKTGKTMAWYDESNVERVKLIKKLQREKFLPLEVIKRMIDSKGSYQQELKLGKAIYKTDKLMNGQAPVPESQLAKRTGYPLDKIRVLEKAGLIIPLETDAGKVYRATDLKVIEMIKAREAMGVPFDHSVNIVKVYRDAISRAVGDDLKLFASGILGDVSTKETVRFMTEADDSLDALVILYRHLFLREAGEDAMARLNSMNELLDLLNFLPPEGVVGGDELPEDPHDGAALLLFRRDWDGARALVDEKSDDPWPAFLVLALVLEGKVDEALESVKAHLPEPGSRPFDNAAAALAYMHSLGRASGFSEPMYLAKRALSYLERIEDHAGSFDLESLFASYVLGAAYVMLPDFFDTVNKGVKILAGLAGVLTHGASEIDGLPGPLGALMRDLVLPSVEARVNLMLALGLVRLGRGSAAATPLERVIRLDQPSPLSERARLLKAKLGI